MSRWRPTPPQSSPYITAAGAQKLQAELRHLWKVERPQVVAAVKAAAANGDRSENGDYIYGKQRLRELDRRISYLSRRLDVLRVVDRLPKDRSRVHFGAWLDLEKESGEKLRVRLVGYDEIDAQRNWISVDSPLARAALGKSENDEICYETPEGQITVWITGIQYTIEDEPATPLIPG